MTAGFVGFFCTLVIVSILRQEVGSATCWLRPIRTAGPRAAAFAWCAAFPIVLLILLPMAGWALAVRIDQYGFTPFRVARLMALSCLGILSALGTLRWLRGRMALTWEVPVCVIAVALVTAFGPLSATQLSIHSQTDRLEHQLTEAGITQRAISATGTKKTHEVDHETYWELGEQIELLAELGGEDVLRRVFDGDVALCAERWNAWHCLELLGVIRENDPHRHTYDSVDLDGTFVTELGQLEFVTLTENRKHQSGAYHLTLTPRAIQLFDGGHWKAEAKLDRLIADWGEGGKRSVRVVDLRSEDGIVVGQIAVRTFRVERLEGKEATIDHLTGVWLEANHR